MAYPHTDWPLHLDSAVARVNGDVINADDFNYPDEQIRTIQEWIGSTGDMLGANIVGEGIGGAVSPVSSGGTAFQFAARNDFVSGIILSVGHKFDTSYSPLMTLDYAGNLQVMESGLFGDGSVMNPGIGFWNASGTGFYNDAGAIAVTQSGMEIASFSGGSIYADSGTEAFPAFSFLSDNDTGVFTPGADEVALVSGGSERFRCDVAGWRSALNGAPFAARIVRSDTLAAAASLVDLEFHGVNSASNQIEFAEIGADATTVTAGSEDGTLTFSVMDAGALTERVEITPQGIGVPAGSTLAPGLYYKGDPDVGIYFASNMGELAAGGTHSFQWGSTFFKSLYAGGTLIHRNTGTATEPTYTFPASTSSSISVHSGMYYDLTAAKLSFSQNSTDVLKLDTAGLDIVSGTLSVSGLQVVTSRQTGWSSEPATSGDRTTTGSYAGQTISGPTVGEVQTIDDNLKTTSERLVALIHDLQNHGLIGA